MTTSSPLLKALECPTCLEYMRGKVYLCCRGHSICQQCSNKVRSCPVCKGLMSRMRNFNLEGVAGQLSLPCDNAFKGCPVYVKQSQLEEHLRQCVYRKYKCRLGDGTLCGWVGDRNEMVSHCDKIHPSKIFREDTHEFSWHCLPSFKPTHVTYLMMAHENLFYLHRIVLDGGLRILVQYIGNSEEATEYIFKVTITSDQYEHRRISITEICTDDLKKTVSDMLDTGYYVSVPLSTIESFAHESHFKCAVTILKI